MGTLDGLRIRSRAPRGGLRASSRVSAPPKLAAIVAALKSLVADGEPAPALEAPSDPGRLTVTVVCRYGYGCVPYGVP